MDIKYLWCRTFCLSSYISYQGAIILAQFLACIHWHLLSTGKSSSEANQDCTLRPLIPGGGCINVYREAGGPKCSFNFILFFSPFYFSFSFKDSCDCFRI